MKSKTKFVLLMLLVIFIAVWANVAKGPDLTEVVAIYFFNVGQGDAELIQKNDYQILIDGGPDDTILQKLGDTMPLNDRKIESMILSHPHADHLVGINQVIDRYYVDKIYLSGVIHASNEYLEFMDKVDEKGIEVIVPNIGYSVVPYNNSKLEFVWPGDEYQKQNSENLNNTSVVNRFCYFDECVLFTGDIEIDEHDKMLNYLNDHKINIESKYLKISHHGSNNGTNQIFLDAVKPEMAIISAGKDNQFGHPHSSIIDLILSSGIALKRTDRDGDIKIIMLDNND